MPPILLTVYPDECDAFGHLNQASFLSLFERARWEMLRAGPGMDLFDRTGAWPAVRKTVIEYHAAGLPRRRPPVRAGADPRRPHQLHHAPGRPAPPRTTPSSPPPSSSSSASIAQGRPVPVPREFNDFMVARRREAGELQRLTVNGVTSRWRSGAKGRRCSSSMGTRSTAPSGPTRSPRSRAGRRIAPDLRGMGQSDAPDLGYSMETYAARPRGSARPAGGVETWCWWGCRWAATSPSNSCAGGGSGSRALVLMDTRAEADTPEAQQRPRHRRGDRPRAGRRRPSPKRCSRRCWARRRMAGAPATVERVQSDDGRHARGRHGRRARRHARPTRQHRAARRARGAADAGDRGRRRRGHAAGPGQAPWPTPFPGASLVVIRSAGHLPHPWSGRSRPRDAILGLSREPALKPLPRRRRCGLWRDDHGP